MANAKEQMDEMQASIAGLTDTVTKLAGVVAAQAAKPTGEQPKAAKVTGIDAIVDGIEIPDKFTTVKNPSGSQHPSVKRVRKLAREKDPVAKLQHYIDATGQFATNAAGEARQPLSQKGWAYKYATQMQIALKGS